MIEILPKTKIYTLIFNLNNRYNIKIVCNILCVSQSWYYKHRKLILNNNTKEQREKQNLKQIKEISLKSKQKYWYRMITMKLLEKSIIMNHKKVLRIMKKNNLLAKIRRKNPYSKIMKATKEHRTYENILNRNFWWLQAYKKLWTDISYLYYNWTRAYISIIKDMITWEIISHKISSSLEIQFVLNTIENIDNIILNWCILHSDQWVHYTSPYYQHKLKQKWIIQSMSRRWNCLDNAPTESFFWHMKDEIDLKNIRSFNELVKYIDNYIFYYNNKRPQWNRKKMTPVQYRNHLKI